MLNFIVDWRRERDTISELSRMSDHELADLGIGRADIWAVASGATMPHQKEVAVQSIDALKPSWGHHNRRALAA